MWFSLILFSLKALCFISCFCVKGDSILEGLCACVYIYVYACVLPSLLGCGKANEHGGREACGPMTTWALPECHHHWGLGPLCFWRQLCAYTLTEWCQTLPGNSPPCAGSETSGNLCACVHLGFLQRKGHIGLGLSHRVSHVALPPAVQ